MAARIHLRSQTRRQHLPPPRPIPPPPTLHIPSAAAITRPLSVAWPLDRPPRPCPRPPAPAAAPPRRHRRRPNLATAPSCPPVHLRDGAGGGGRLARARAVKARGWGRATVTRRTPSALPPWSRRDAAPTRGCAAVRDGIGSAYAARAACRVGQGWGEREACEGLGRADGDGQRGRRSDRWLACERRRR